MAQQVLSIADKPTLDIVNGKCDDILDAVQSGGGTGTGGGYNLNKVHVFILDTANDEVVM